MRLSNLSKFAISIATPQLAGLIGGIFTASSVATWYVTLMKPSFNPPSWVFSPVWTTLYLLMGIAAFIVWKRGLERDGVRLALSIFLGQLILNSLWSVIFFGLRSPGWAVIEIAFLWIAIAATIVVFARVSRFAAWLLAPYIAWVSFAAFLNYNIWALNS